TGAPAAIVLTCGRTRINADRVDISMIKVSVVDDQGRPVPTADNQLAFTLAGPGKIIGVGNGDPSSHESDKDPSRKLFNGLAQVIVQAGDTTGEFKLTASCEGLKPATISIQTQSATPIPAIP